MGEENIVSACQSLDQHVSFETRMLSLSGRKNNGARLLIKAVTTTATSSG